MTSAPNGRPAGGPPDIHEDDMRLSVIAACCAALSLGACQSPAVLVESVRVLNDGCDREVEATMTFATPMPPSGTVKITKTCRAASRVQAGAVVPVGPSP